MIFKLEVGMAFDYRADRQIITYVLEKLKTVGAIALDAQFDESSYQNLRREVFPRDLDFLHMARIRPITATTPSIESPLPLDPAVIENALNLLKRNGFVAADAYFNAEEPHKLATEVRYRDLYFLYYLGLYAELEISTAVLALLKRIGAIDVNSTYSLESFEKLRQEVTANFKIPDTAFSPTLERLLYMFASVKRPKSILGIGIFCGYTLVWTAGAACHEGNVYQADKIYGIDIDADAITLAKQNFKHLSDIDHLELVAEDGRITADRLSGPFDYLYLDADSPENGKGIYLELLQILYPKLSKGCWVLAHDTTLPAFRNKLERYLDFVRDQNNFSESISFDVDIFGLELSIK
jgi:predicted O-methyltransferase YrrM